MVSSVALPVLWRMRGKVQRSGALAPGREGYESGLRDRPADRAESLALGDRRPLAQVRIFVVIGGPMECRQVRTNREAG